jgi:protein-S-isoprenylcysteine O-methyltransferase Ste14
MPLFSSGFENIVFVSTVGLWVFSEFVGGGIIPRLQRRGKEVTIKDNGSNLVLRVSLYVSIIIAFFLAVNNTAMLPHWFFYPGIGLIVLGIIVRQWAIFTLGRFFTLTIGVQKNQKVVDYGPYRFIRHPSYLGLLITLLGIGVAPQSWEGVLAIVVISGLAIGYRIHIEEKVMVLELGDDYVQYMKRTKRLIPYIV